MVPDTVQDRLFKQGNERLSKSLPFFNPFEEIAAPLMPARTVR
jgi:hypothetical protein